MPRKKKVRNNNSTTPSSATTVQLIEPNSPPITSHVSREASPEFSQTAGAEAILTPKGNELTIRLPAAANTDNDKSVLTPTEANGLSKSGSAKSAESENLTPTPAVEMVETSKEESGDKTVADGSTFVEPEVANPENLSTNLNVEASNSPKTETTQIQTDFNPATAELSIQIPKDSNPEPQAQDSQSSESATSIPTMGAHFEMTREQFDKLEKDEQNRLHSIYANIHFSEPQSNSTEQGSNDASNSDNAPKQSREAELSIKIVPNSAGVYTELKVPNSTPSVQDKSEMPVPFMSSLGGGSWFDPSRSILPIASHAAGRAAQPQEPTVSANQQRVSSHDKEAVLFGIRTTLGWTPVAGDEPASQTPVPADAKPAAQPQQLKATATKPAAGQTQQPKAPVTEPTAGQSQQPKATATKPAAEQTQQPKAPVIKPAAGQTQQPKATATKPAAGQPQQPKATVTEPAAGQSQQQNATVIESDDGDNSNYKSDNGSEFEIDNNSVKGASSVQDSDLPNVIKSASELTRTLSSIAKFKFTANNALVNKKRADLEAFLKNYHAKALALQNSNPSTAELEQLLALSLNIEKLANSTNACNLDQPAIAQLTATIADQCDKLPKRSNWKLLGAIALGIASVVFLAGCIIAAIMVSGAGLGGTAPLGALLLLMGIQATQLALTITLATTASVAFIASPLSLFAAIKLAQQPKTAELEAATREGLGFFKAVPSDGAGGSVVTQPENVPTIQAR